MTALEKWRTYAASIEDALVREHKDFAIIEIPSAQLMPVLKDLRDPEQHHMDFLKYVAAVDWKEQFEVIYHLYSYPKDQEVLISVRIDSDAPVLPTAEQIWPAANWHEREIYDLFGIEFTDHSNLERLLLPPDWVGHPLRKDYQQEDAYQGVSTKRNYMTELPQAIRDEES